MGNTDVIKLSSPYAAPASRTAQPSSPAARGLPAVHTFKTSEGRRVATPTPPAGGYDYSNPPSDTDRWLCGRVEVRRRCRRVWPQPTHWRGYAASPTGGQEVSNWPGRVIATAAVVSVLAGAASAGPQASPWPTTRTSLTSSGTSAGTTRRSKVPGGHIPLAGNSISTIAKRMLPTVVSDRCRGGPAVRNWITGYIVSGRLHRHQQPCGCAVVERQKISVVFNDKTCKEATLVGRSPYDWQS